MKRLVCLVAACAWLWGCGSSDSATAVEPGDQDAALGTDGNADALADGDADPDAGSGLWVSPSGSDQAPCSEAAPCKTLTHAISIVQAGQTIHLDAGTYKDLETFPITVPDNVTIEGKSAAETILAVDSLTDGLVFTGSVTLSKLQLKGFLYGIQGETGSIKVQNVDFLQTLVGFYLTSTARASCENCSFKNGTTAFGITDISSFSLKNATISDMGPNCGGGTGIGNLSDSSSAYLENVTAENTHGSLDLRGSSRAMLRNCRLINNGPDGCGGGETINMAEWPTLTLEQTTIQGGHGTTIDAAGDVTITKSTLSNSPDSAIRMDYGRLTIRDSLIVGSGPDAYMYGVEVSESYVTISGSTITNFDTGIYSSDEVRMTLRNNLIHNNYDCIRIETDSVNDEYDFGTSSEPGGNTIRDCSSMGLTIVGNSDLIVDAAGNTWNPYTQGADRDGHIPAGQLLTGPYTAPGRNFYIAFAGPKLQF